MNIFCSSTDGTDGHGSGSASHQDGDLERRQTGPCFAPTSRWMTGKRLIAKGGFRAKCTISP
jgi:hypothetical protein